MAKILVTQWPKFWSEIAKILVKQWPKFWSEMNGQKIGH
jgi:hypothetical protein